MRSFVLDSCTIFRVQSWAIAASAPVAARHLLGVEWPMRTGTVVTGRTDVVCVGPTEWLVIAPDERDSTLLFKPLTEAFVDSPFRATDLSSALIRIRLEGESVRTLLSQGCGVDFHPEQFLPGQSARTRLAGMPVVLRCIEAAGFECIVSRSYQDYLLAWFADATLSSETGS
jgi:sarcosine oxidase subunit gamma